MGSTVELNILTLEVEYSQPAPMEQVVRQIKAYVGGRGFSTSKASDISWRDDFFAHYEGKLVMCMGVETHLHEGWVCVEATLYDGL